MELRTQALDVRGVELDCGPPGHSKLVAGELIWSHSEVTRVSLEVWASVASWTPPPNGATTFNCKTCAGLDSMKVKCSLEN